MQFMDYAMKFLPTPSARRATIDLLGLLRRVGISTHALREEGDSVKVTSLFLR